MIDLKDSVLCVIIMFLEMNFTTCSNVSFFKDLRKLYLPKYYLRYVNTLKFQKLLSTTNIKLLKQLSRFVSEVLSKF